MERSGDRPGRPGARSAHLLLTEGAIRTSAVPVHDQRMVANRESQALCYGGLALFDPRIHELFDAAAVKANDVIVVGAMVELENGHAVFEVVSGDEPSRLKLRQHAID